MTEFKWIIVGAVAIGVLMFADSAFKSYLAHQNSMFCIERPVE